MGLTQHGSTRAYNNYDYPGTYIVTLVLTNSFGCQDSSHVTLFNNPIPTPNYSVLVVCAVSPTCFTDLTTIDWGTIASWNWNFGDSASSSNTSNLQNPCHSYSSLGEFTISLEVKSDSGCQSKLIAGQGAIVDSCVGILNISENKTIYISPNPIHTSAILITNGIKSKFKIYNSFGTLVHEERINDQITTINRNSLANGVYFFQLIDNNGQSTNGKLVIE